MPTFNQLIHTGRAVSEKKAKAPALLKGWNSKKRIAIDQDSPQKRGVSLLLRLLPRRSRTPHFVRLPEFVFPTVSKSPLTSRVLVTTCRSIALL